MANILIDSNVFQKLYGYYKSKNNNDNVIDIEKLYTELLQNDNMVSVPVHCIYEIFSKPFYNNQLKNLFYFMLEARINILTLSEGNPCIFQYSIDDFEELNIKKTLNELLKTKIKYEQSELKEYMLYTVFVIKYVIVNHLKLKLYDNNLCETNLDKIVLSLFDDKKSHLGNIFNNFVLKELNEGYINNNAKEKVKTFFVEFCGKVFDEVYSNIKYANPFINDILDAEQQELYKFSNKLEYLKNKLQQVEKRYNINLLENINDLYFKELMSLGYPINFVKYLLYVLNKLIRNAHFDKNDTIDCSLFLYNNQDFIITFDTSVCCFLEKEHQENYCFINKFKK